MGVSHWLIKILICLLKGRDREAFLADLEELGEMGEQGTQKQRMAQLLLSIGPVFFNFIRWNGLMIFNHLMISVRQIRKRWVEAGLHVLGLTLGFAASLLIMVYVSHQSGYDRFRNLHERTYRLQANTYRNGILHQASAVTVPALGPALESQFLQVEASARFSKAFL